MSHHLIKPKALANNIDLRDTDKINNDIVFVVYTAKYSELTHSVKHTAFICESRKIYFRAEITKSIIFFLQALAFIPPIRDFFLREENYQNIKRPPGDIMFPLGRRVISFNL